MPVSSQHHQQVVNGFRMHYVDAGSGPPLVLLHGWPQSWYEWRRVIERIGDRHRLIVPDLRGLGDSERPMTGYDKRTLASDVAELLRALGINRAGVIGHDWGAAVGYYLAYDHTELVDRLMVLDMIPGLARADTPIPLEIARKIHHIFFHGGNYDLASQFARPRIRNYLQHIFTSLVYNYSPALLNPEDIDEYVRVHSAPGALRAGSQYYSTGLREDADNLVANTGLLEQPVDVWFGDVFLGSVFDGPNLWAPYARNITGGRIDNCGHFVPEERPDVVAELVRNFFAATSPDPRHQGVSA